MESVIGSMGLETLATPYGLCWNFMNTCSIFGCLSGGSEILFPLLPWKRSSVIFSFLPLTLKVLQLKKGHLFIFRAGAFHLPWCMALVKHFALFCSLALGLVARDCCIWKTSTRWFWHNKDSGCDIQPQAALRIPREVRISLLIIVKMGEMTYLKQK